MNILKKILSWFGYVRELETAFKAASAKIEELERHLKSWRDHAISLEQQLGKNANTSAN